MTELLRTHSRVRSTDIEEYRDAVTKVFHPHRMDPYPHRDRDLSVFNAIAFEDVALCYHRHGVPVRLRYEPLRSMILVRFSLTGSLSVRAGRREMQYDPRTVGVFDPDIAYDTSIEAGSAALVLRFKLSAVQAELHRILGRPPSRRLSFATSLSMAAPRMRSWFAMVQSLCADLDGPGGVGHPAMHRPVQQILIGQLLTTARHSASDEMTGATKAVSEALTPRTIRRADQIIADHCREALTVSDIAEAVGVSVRSLQHGFKKYLNTTPVERIRQARLSGVHAELLASDHTRVSVSQVASDWGFRHFGRFANSYRQAFGERPSQTLRR